MWDRRTRANLQVLHSCILICILKIRQSRQGKKGTGLTVRALLLLVLGYHWLFSQEVVQAGAMSPKRVIRRHESEVRQQIY